MQQARVPGRLAWYEVARGNLQLARVPSRLAWCEVAGGGAGCPPPSRRGRRDGNHTAARRNECKCISSKRVQAQGQQQATKQDKAKSSSKVDHKTQTKSNLAKRERAPTEQQKNQQVHTGHRQNKGHPNKAEPSSTPHRARSRRQGPP